MSKANDYRLGETPTTLTFRLSRGLRDQIVAYAEREGMSQSDLLRQAARRFLGLFPISEMPVPKGFLDHLPPDEQAEYGVGKGATVKGVGRLHSGWPNVKGVLKSSTNTDPYAEETNGPEDT